MAVSRGIGQGVPRPRPGQSTFANFRGPESNVPAVGICAEFRCVEGFAGQGSDVAILVMFARRVGRVQWARFTWGDALQSCMPNRRAFAIYPD